MLDNLCALQAAANNSNSQAHISWIALNNIIGGQNDKAPAIDFDRFSEIWDTDPSIQKVVASFDEAEIILRTDNMGQTEMPAPNPGRSNIETMAKRATNRALKK